jgi:hypothetical protein
MKRLALAALLAVPTSLVAQAPAEPPVLPFDSLAFRGGEIDNPHFPLVPGTKLIFEIRDDRDHSIDTVEVLTETKRIAGVTATVVHDREWRRGVLVEDTYDWYAQDIYGNVWYLGEDTKSFKSGKASTAGSWKAGTAGASAGIIMRSKPKLGESYRQEYRKGVAEDMARVVSISDAESVRAGRYKGCVTTEEWSPLEPNVKERKTYCPGAGLVRGRTVTGGLERTELIAIVTP